VYSKNLELFAFDAADPASGVYGLAVGRHHVGIPERSQASLAFREFTDATERHPRKVTVAVAAGYRREQEPHDRQGKGGCQQAGEKHPHLNEQPGGGKCVFVRHLQPPNVGFNSKQSMAALVSDPGVTQAKKLCRYLPDQTWVFLPLSPASPALPI